MAAVTVAPASAADPQHGRRVQLSEQFVRQCIAEHGADSSHDWWHIHRVRNSALALAAREGLTVREGQLAELAALLHDVADRKYSANPDADRHKLKAFLAAPLGLAPEQQATVLFVIDSMSFSAELARQQAQQQESEQPKQHRQGEQQRQQQERILAVVQDADRLDAIGAVGIARCLTFGGRFNRVLHDPTVPPRCQLSAEQYTDAAAAVQQTTLNHFDEKLLKLKGLMRTAAGRQMAEGRHEYMQCWLDRFHAEWRGEA